MGLYSKNMIILLRERERERKFPLITIASFQFAPTLSSAPSLFSFSLFISKLIGPSLLLVFISISDPLSKASRFCRHQQPSQSPRIKVYN